MFWDKHTCLFFYKFSLPSNYLMSPMPYPRSGVPETGCALLADDYSISSKCRSNKCLKFLKYLLSVYHHKFQSRGIEIPLTVRNIRLPISIVDSDKSQLPALNHLSILRGAVGSALSHLCRRPALLHVFS